MKELDYILMEHGIVLYEDDIQVQQDDQQIDQNQQQVQDPNSQTSDTMTQNQDADEDDEDINSQQYDENGNPIPNTVDSTGNTNTIQTPEFSNEEIAARYNVIEDYKKISSMARKIREIKFYDTTFDLEDMLNSIDSILKNISVFSTDDLIKYKDFMIDKLSSNLVKIKTGFNEIDDKTNKKIESKQKENIEDKDTSETLKESLDFLYDLNRKIKLDLSLDDAISMLTQAMYKKIHSLDEEDFIDVYGYKYKSSTVVFILRDAVEMLNILYKNKKISLNDNIGTYLFNYADNYYKKEGVSVIFESAVRYDLHSKKILICRIPDQYSIVHFAVHLRCAVVEYLNYKNKLKDIKYKDSVIECYKSIIKKIGEKVFKNENIIDVINQMIENGYITNEQSTNLEYLTRFDSNANKITNPSYINALEKWIALLTYFNSVNSRSFPEWDKMFIKSYKEGFIEYLENHVNELEHIFFIRNYDNPNNYLYLIQGFSNIQFLTSNLERH